MQHKSTWIHFLPWENVLVAAIVILSTVCVQAQEAEAGKVVTIDGSDDRNDLKEEIRVVEEQAYWIGIQGHSIDSEVLRTHLQLAAELGVVVEQVIDDSPAAKAGLRRHDILLRANGDAIDNMQSLQEHVRSGKDQPLELKIIRLGKKETIVVVPEPRRVQPGEVLQELPGARGDNDLMQQLMRQFGNRNIGPGVILRGGNAGVDFNQMPGGISVSVQRNNNEPAQITVKRGDATWTIVGDDEKSLEQLPADVRPFVERMLNNRQGNVRAFGGNLPNGFGGDFNFGNIEQELERVLPNGLGRFDRPRVPNRLGDPMLERMEQLENQLKALQRRFRDEVDVKKFEDAVDDGTN